MRFVLTEVTGLAQAITSLKMSKRHYHLGRHLDLMQFIRAMSDYRGFIQLEGRSEKDYSGLIDEMNKLAKWGAGVGNGGAWKDDGHETLLRFIDLSFVTLGLHRAAQDDLDAHAKRFDNRIVRASTRLGEFSAGERSMWYERRIRSIEDMMTATGLGTPPEEYTDDAGTIWVYSGFGYVRKDLFDSTEKLDAKRGNYPLSIPSDAIWKISLFDLRHVYMRRNKYTHANPELRIGIEQLAYQVEIALPGDLGKLVRYDYALVPRVDENGKSYIPENPTPDDFKLVHTMDVRKVYCPRVNPNADTANE